MALLELSMVTGAIIEMGVEALANKIGRNEAIIRTLRKLNLSKHPPTNDFDAVYTYTLIEWGMFKPAPILNFFRNEFIRQAFYQAYYKNDWSLLDKEAEEVIDWDTEIGVIGCAAEGIDPRLEFATFTEIFKEIIDQGRRPIEVKFDQKLDTLNFDTKEILGRLDLLLTEKNASTDSNEEDKQYFESPISADDYLKRGTYHYHNKKYEETIVDVSRAIQLEPELVDAYIVRGNSYYRINSYEQAVADFSRVIHLQPNNYLAYYLRGDIYSSWLGKHALGISDFDNAIALKSDFEQAYAHRGSTYRLLGNYDQSIKDLEQAIRIDPSNMNAWYWLGLTYSKIEENEKAVHCFNEAVRVEPEYINAFFCRGIEFYRIGNFHKAIKDLSRIVENYPYYDIKRFSSAYTYRGLAYCKIGEYIKAIADFSNVIRLQPNNPESYYFRGEAYLCIGKKQEAIIDYKQSIKLGDSAQLRQQVVEKLSNVLSTDE